jgi:hypothetical protein
VTPGPSITDDPRVFVALFIIGWFSISLILSLLGGWFMLASQFRGTSAAPLGKSYWFASMSIRTWFIPVSYRNCIFATVSSEGVGLSIFPVFRLGHPRLFIPWSAASDCTQKTYLFWTRTVLEIKKPGCKISFWGRMGDEVFSRYATAT